MYNILDFTLEELQNWMKENGESAFRAKQVFSWIYKEVWNFDEMKNIPGSLKEKLKENFTIEIPKIVEVYESNVDDTKKMLLFMKDNNLIECVLMKYKHGNSIGQRHITLSTCGIVPKIIELADLNLSITLAISLHAFSDEKRKTIMPIANKYSINEILESCRYYMDKTGRRITYEYSLVSGVNDGKEDAKSLAKLLKNMSCHVSLIPVNEIKENELKRPSKRTIEAFEEILKSQGIEVTVRREMGTDINAACGQLRRSYIDTQK